MTTDGS